jgi:hypothetical protein
MAIKNSGKMVNAINIEGNAKISFERRNSLTEAVQESAQAA